MDKEKQTTTKHQGVEEVKKENKHLSVLSTDGGKTYVKNEFNTSEFGKDTGDGASSIVRQEFRKFETKNLVGNKMVTVVQQETRRFLPPNSKEDKKNEWKVNKTDPWDSPITKDEQPGWQATFDNATEAYEGAKQNFSAARYHYLADHQNPDMKVQAYESYLEREKALETLNGVKYTDEQLELIYKQARTRQQAQAKRERHALYILGLLQ